MNNALRDQLLKAGLITEDQVKVADDKPRREPSPRKPKRADAERKRERRVTEDTRPPRRKPTPEPSAARVRSKPTNGGKAAKASNPAQTPSPYAHLDKAQREAVRRFLREQRVNAGDGETPYHFQEGAAVRKIWVTAAQRQMLADGALVIVPRNERYYVIDAAQVEPLQVLDPKVKIIRADALSDEDEDPAYKDHPIPDDLVW
ncbi:hypothetical protein BI364_04455 [Acidihalobacter yilgarnensis]|uniref:Nucleoprotein/polynucleotide-associated enzyme n=1 Tax=Acidihalobacter yilgarnensis TaxID=2819280 RepID=A0A1D8ILL7_9GAMM|nr:DUF2058 family protein [Acidihalobacter yilgarnensis]AOU97342.1 hypothetical protein BI364_04455 [Acidihalobacter yilgarnensis]